MFATFREYENAPKMVPLVFTEDDLTWVALNIVGATGGLGYEAIELRNLDYSIKMRIGGVRGCCC